MSSHIPASGVASGQGRGSIGRGTARGCAISFFAVFLAGGCAFFYFIFLHPAIAGWRARDWKATPCVIVSSGVQSHRGSDGHAGTYSVGIRYRYMVNAHRYESDRYRFLSGSSSGYAAKAAIVSRYPAGASATCYVNPRAPAEAVIERDIDSDSLAGLAMLLFYLVGTAGIIGVLTLGRQVPVIARGTEVAHPWLRRADWAAGRVVYSTRAGERFAWWLAVAWGVVAVPVTSVVAPAALQPGRHILALGLIVPAVELLLLVLAARATQRRRLFGDSVFELSTLPGEIGGALQGVLRLNRPLRAQKGMTLTLRCVDTVVHSGAHGSLTSSRTLWSAEQVAAPPIDQTVSVAFAIPADCPPTCLDGRETVSWKLEATASENDVRYKADFDVPVFPVILTPAQATEAAALRARVRREATDLGLPLTSRIRVRDTLAGGKEFYFPPCRNVGVTVGLGLFLTAWCGAIAVMIALKAPLWFPIVFGVFAILMMWWLLYMLLWRTRVLVRPGLLTVAGGFVSEGRVRRIPAADIARIGLKTGMNANNVDYLDITVILKNGKRITAGAYLKSRPEAQWLANEMATAAGVASGEVSAEQ